MAVGIWMMYSPVIPTNVVRAALKRNLPKSRTNAMESPSGSYCAPTMARNLAQGMAMIPLYFSVVPHADCAFNSIADVRLCKAYKSMSSSAIHLPSELLKHSCI